MPKKIAVSTLNASTIDILNVIRQNASFEYQNQVPAVETYEDIPKVGQIICGYPALANQFLSALVNRIALVRVQSATFNNPYRDLKKGYLEFGETIEDIFVNIANVFEYKAEKAEQRELKRYLPDVKAAFYAKNWTVVYPITIEDMQLRQAFLSMEGVQDMIARIVDSVYTAAEYDEFLLFKYLIIKAVSSGKAYPQYVGTGEDPTKPAVEFRAISNQLLFMSKDYNPAHVMNTTPRDRQYIFMDAHYNAQFDVEVLAGAFNMDKADFMGRLYLIDNWTTFDNERFSHIMAESDGLEEVTAEELALMKDVVSVIVDGEFFQVYDNLTKFTEKYAASGLYWNYFLHSWKTIAYSPYANIVAFVKGAEAPALPTSITGHVDSVDIGDNATVINISTDMEAAAFTGGDALFLQTPDAVTAGIAIHKYGSVMFPPASTASLTLKISVGGQVYVASEAVTTATKTGTDITFTPQPAASAASISVQNVSTTAKKGASK